MEGSIFWMLMKNHNIIQWDIVTFSNIIYRSTSQSLKYSSAHTAYLCLQVCLCLVFQHQQLVYNKLWLHQSQSLFLHNASCSLTCLIQPSKCLTCNSVTVTCSSTYSVQYIHENIRKLYIQLLVVQWNFKYLQQYAVILLDDCMKPTQQDWKKEVKGGMKVFGRIVASFKKNVHEGG